MRILLTTDTVGGVWTFTRELSEALLSHGHEVRLVSFGRSASVVQKQWADTLSEVYASSFVYISSTAPLEWMTENDRCWHDGCAILQRVISAFQPDVIHVNQFCFGALKTNAPKVITAHSDVLSWMESCRPQGQQSSVWLDTYCDLVQSGLDGADAIVAPTMWMLRALQRNFRLKSEAIRVIANARSTPKTWQRERRLQAVTLGRLWDEGKGLQTLLNVSWSLPVVIAGEQSFEEMSAPECQNDGITWLGMLDEEEVTALLHSSSVYIAPSIYEPFGLAVLEAALCGCALLLRDLSSFREVWADAALYFSTDEQLEAAAAELSRDGKLLTRMQRAAHKYAEHYSVEKMTISYLDLYSEAISACGSGELTYVA